MSVGVILTGMGRDGAAGLLAMRNAGARTLGQNQASSVVYGMPKVAFEWGAVEKQLPLARVGHEILALAATRSQKGERDVA
jgi:two-component system chemotaxis response regulator CheB